MKFYDLFQSRADIVSNFSIDDTALPPDADILYAGYTYEDYSGSAFVLYRTGDELFEVNGGHCSCNGLEGQWEPERTTVAALKLRIGNTSWHGLDEVLTALPVGVRTPADTSDTGAGSVGARWRGNAGSARQDDSRRQGRTR